MRGTPPGLVAAVKRIRFIPARTGNAFNFLEQFGMNVPSRGGAEFDGFQVWVLTHDGYEVTNRVALRPRAGNLPMSSFKFNI